MWIGSTLAGLGGQLTIVAIMLHMYDLTGSTFAVAMIAVVGLLPMIVAGLYGGMLADAFDRRRVALIAATITLGLDRAAGSARVGAARRRSGGCTL